MSQVITNEYAVQLIVEHGRAITIAMATDLQWKPTQVSIKSYTDPKTGVLVEDAAEASTIDRNSPLYAARIKAIRNQLAQSESINGKGKRKAKKQVPKIYFGKEVRVYPFIVHLDSKV